MGLCQNKVRRCGRLFYKRRKVKISFIKCSVYTVILPWYESKFIQTWRDKNCTVKFFIFVFSIGHERINTFPSE